MSVCAVDILCTSLARLPTQRLKIVTEGLKSSSPEALVRLIQKAAEEVHQAGEEEHEPLHQKKAAGAKDSRMAASESILQPTLPSPFHNTSPPPKLVTQGAEAHLYLGHDRLDKANQLERCLRRV